jgi:hypothetical protein
MEVLQLGQILELSAELGDISQVGLLVAKLPKIEIKQLHVPHLPEDFSKVRDVRDVQFVSFIMIAIEIHSLDHCEWRKSFTNFR